MSLHSLLPTLPRLPALLSLLGLLAGGTTVPAAETTVPRIPVEDFARSPDLNAAELSPDGKYMGYLFTHDGQTEMGFLDLATGKAKYFNPGRSVAGGNLQMGGFTWVSDERVVVLTTIWGQWSAGLAAINRTGSGWMGLTGAPRWDSIKTSSGVLNASEIIYASGKDPTDVLMLDRTVANSARAMYPDVITMDTTNGNYRSVLTNPGKVIHWMADWDGVVRFGLEWDGKGSRLVYRDGATSPWQVRANAPDSPGESSFVGVEKSGQTIHVAQPNAQGRWALFPLDLKQNRRGDALFAHDEYDIVPADFRPSYAGASLTKAIYSPKTRELLGVRYVTEGPNQHWFDPAMASWQKQLDALHPEVTNTILGLDHAGTRLLVLSWSDREPGFYSVVDLAAKKANVLGQRMPWIKPEQMAPMYPIKCQARDGRPLHGYLTLPAQGGKKNLPLVTLVHGGPWVRDVWGFDPLVQFLANRGYAVLQVNYRGSVGYGVDFAASGKGQIGGAIQSDIADAVQWTIRAGIADPKRIAIMGASYGGYSVLFGLAKNPELFRCGIDIAGVTDWLELLDQRSNDPDFQIANAYWAQRIGAIDNDQVRKQLSEASPTNFAAQIQAPLLIVHGKEDQIVPFSQTKRLIALMKQQGRTPETLFLGDLGHSFPRDKQGVEFLRKVETFLAKNLAP